MTPDLGRAAAPPPMQIRIESPRQPDVVALIDALDAYQRPLYPPESHHGIDLDALAAPDVLFAVVRDAGAAVGCGALVLGAEHGELKRMYLQPALRGRGLAAQLLAFLEAEARARGCHRFRLETGHLQAAAIALYEAAGYRRIGPFGSYRGDPNSVFMGKDPEPALRLQLADSELASCTQEGADLLLRLSAARVERPAADGSRRSEAAWAQHIELRLVAVRERAASPASVPSPAGTRPAAASGDPAPLRIAPGRIREGRLHRQGHWQRELPLPGRLAGPLVLELTPALGEEVVLQASALICRHEGEARVLDSLFC